LSRLPAVLVQRTTGLARDTLGRAQHPTGIASALAGAVIDRPKERDAGPQVRFCERCGGAIHRAYSTVAEQRRA
jgi:hypothetical protein